MDDLTQREFLLELEELTEQLFATTADLRRPETSEPQRREILARAFRCLHSIKGVASSGGFSAVAELAHQSESVLDLARAGRIKLNSAFIDTLEDVANTIAEGVAEIVSGKSERATDILGRRLRAFAAEAVGAMDLADLPAVLANSLNETEKRLVMAAIRRQANIFSINVRFAAADFESQFHKLRETLTQSGEVISTLPSAAGPAADLIDFKIVYASELEASEVQTRLTATVTEAIVTNLFQFSRVAPDRAEQPAATAGSSAISVAATSSFIRVELAELDRLRTSAHGLFERLLRILDQADDTEWPKLQPNLRQSLAALEEQIVALRTIPVGRVIQRAVRAGQVAAQSADKQVAFSVAGANLRIDKEICEAIANPLIHLIRNAVDHGIEAPAERNSAGKNPAGRVHIEARLVAGEIRFVVSDDGRGIDPKVISLAATTRGMIEKDTVLDLDQSLRLIFRPGFSTAPVVSNLSGRGVGLDVVEHSVLAVGGSVSVQSWPGKGSEFTLHLPGTSNPASLESLSAQSS